MQRPAFHLLIPVALVFAFCAAAAAHGGASRDALTRTALEGGAPAAGLVPNAAFLPADDAGAALHAFSGTLVIPEFRLHSAPDPIVPGLLMGKDPQRFPALRLDFVSADGDLIPAEREIIRTTGDSYWDVIVDPGRTWSEPGDGGLSRASFPFVLMNHIEGESYNGVASFLYDDARVSGIALQIVQQTAPFLVPTAFTAWGSTPVHYQPHAMADAERLIGERRIERGATIPLASIEAFRARFPGVATDALEPGSGDTAGVFTGLVDGSTIYTAGCPTPAGAFPYCADMRHGVWSVTKSMTGGVALLRIAQKFGDGIHEQRIAALIPAAEVVPAWQTVRLIDAANMATGIGSGSAVAEPNDIDSGYLDDAAAYNRWYEAPTVESKLALTFAERAYPWGPGKVARYRDQDPFVLGVAIDTLLRQREGPGASLDRMLRAEVYRPLGIVHRPQTVFPREADGSVVPMASYGLFPTVGDMARIARLLQDRGRHGGEQILSASAIGRFLDTAHAHGLPTGQQTPAGETLYEHYFWQVPFADGDCRRNIPQMLGWGGVIVALYPNGMTGIRVAKSMGDATQPWSADALAHLAHAARSFCP